MGTGPPVKWWVGGFARRTCVARGWREAAYRTMISVHPHHTIPKHTLPYYTIPYFVQSKTLLDCPCEGCIIWKEEAIELLRQAIE